MAESRMQSNKRFDVALSFPGEYRSFVQGVAEVLEQKLSQEQVFYDKWYEAELARPNLDTYLQRIYHDKAELVVVFLCTEYEKKVWCGLEWRAIRNLLSQKQDEAIMLIRFDDTVIPGLYSIDGYVNAANRRTEAIANLILERLNLNRQSYSAKVEQQTASNRTIQQSLLGTDDFKSDRNIDYTHLQDLLKANKWQEADQETAKKMSEVMGRQKEGWLRIEDIEKFPCIDLLTIDRLWVKYSWGRFGFSVQKTIWQQYGSPTEYGENWEKFGEAVGWRIKGWKEVNRELQKYYGTSGKYEDKVIWKNYDQLTFDIKAPKGHLPMPIQYLKPRQIGSESFYCEGSNLFSPLAQRFVSCSI